MWWGGDDAVWWQESAARAVQQQREAETQAEWLARARRRRRRKWAHLRFDGDGSTGDLAGDRGGAATGNSATKSGVIRSLLRAVDDRNMSILFAKRARLMRRLRRVDRHACGRVTRAQWWAVVRRLNQADEGFDFYAGASTAGVAAGAADAVAG